MVVNHVSTEVVNPAPAVVILSLIEGSVVVASASTATPTLQPTVTADGGSMVISHVSTEVINPAPAPVPTPTPAAVTATPTHP